MKTENLEKSEKLENSNFDENFVNGIWTIFFENS